MTALIDHVPASVFEELVHQVIPEKIVKGLRLQLGLKLKPIASEINILSHFLRLVDRCYGHLSPGGIDGYLENQNEKLKIDLTKQTATEWNISKAISCPVQAEALVVLYVLLKCLPQLKRLPKMRENTPSAAEHKRKRNMILAKYHIRIHKIIANEAELNALSEACHSQLSKRLSDLCLREHRLLNSSILFARNNLEKVTLNILSPIEKNLAVNGRVYLRRPIMATVIQGGKSYPSQLIEYSANGAGLSVLIIDITHDKKGKMVHNTQDISIQIGSKKCTGSIIHQSPRGIGLYLGIQLRYPVHNWDTLIN